MTIRNLISFLFLHLPMIAHAGPLSIKSTQIRTQVIQMAKAHDVLPKFLEKSAYHYMVGTALIKDSKTFNVEALECDLALRPTFESKLDLLLERANGLAPYGAKELLSLLKVTAEEKLTRMSFDTPSSRVKIRQHRSNLSQSMATVVEIDRNMTGLRALIIKELGVQTPAYEIEVIPYGGIDARTGWNTYMIKVDGIPYGFSDGPIN